MLGLHGSFRMREGILQTEEEIFIGSLVEILVRFFSNALKFD